MVLTRWVWGSLAVLTCVACTCGFEVTIPPGTLIDCVDDFECPEGYRCRTTIGRCISIEDLADAEPTFPVDPAVEPALAREGTLIEASFSVSQPLFRDPLVYIETGNDRVEFVVNEEKTSRDASIYVFELIATGTEPEDVLTVRADLLDRLGNEARGQRLGSVTFDFTAPGVVPGSETIHLSPSPSNVLRHVTRVTVGTTVRVGFNVTEPLGSSPVVFTASPEHLSFEKVGEAGYAFVYAYTLDTRDVLQGAYDIDILLTDLAGNSATVRLDVPEPRFVIDTVPPAPPDVDTRERIVYQRRPWGAADTGGRAAMRVIGVPGAIEADGTLLVYSTQEEPRAEIARARADQSGRFEPIELPPFDRPSIYVGAADAAGNVSEIVAVRDVEWVTTLGGKVVDSTVENPHRLERRSWQGVAPPDFPGPEVGAAAGVALPNGVTTVAQGGGRWIDPFRAPPQRALHSMVYEEARGRVLLFGGAGPTGYSNDTWEWNGEAWSRVFPAGSASPDARVHHAMIYDSARHRAVLFGGHGPFWERLGDTWEWDGQRWSRAASTDEDSPSARYSHAMAYDARRGRTVLFGGWGGGNLGDTWEWDGESWHEVQPADSLSPSPRHAHAMVYDEARERVILFGGRAESGPPLADTWAWDGNAWEPIATSGTAPAGREGHAMAYDMVRERVVLFGGSDDWGWPTFKDTWEWDGEAWLRIEPESAKDPHYRYGHAMVYDPSRGCVVLFGGNVDDPFSMDDPSTWSWDGDAWKRTMPATGDVPPERSGHAVAYDTARGRLVLYGGFQGYYSEPLGDTWEWDGEEWHRMQPAGGVTPGRRHSHAMVYDAGRGRVVLFGGEGPSWPLNTVWEWDGVRWTEIAPSNGAAPQMRDGHAMAYDSRRGRTVMFGGGNFSWEPEPHPNETWEWDGQSWERIEIPSGAAPSARHGHAMAFDENRERTVLFGGRESAWLGSPFFNDTWEWDGETWTEVGANSAVVPDSRAWHAMAYDSSRDRVVMFAGMDTWRRDDTWEWDGTAWLRIPPFGGPGPTARAGHAMAYDATRGRVLVFGGQDNEGRLDETWEWDGGANARPSFLFLVDARYAFMPTASVLSSFFVSAVAGASSIHAGEMTTGLEVYAWHAGSWLELASSSAGHEHPQPISRSSTDPSIVMGLLSRNEIHVLLMPSGFNEDGPRARIALDYIEARLRYRRP